VIRLAHLTDLHFGRIDNRLIRPLIDALTAARPDIVVVSGDLTMRAREREFRDAAAFVQALPAPCFLVPGNHDIPSGQVFERLVDPFRRWRRHFGPELEPTVVDERLALIGVNSVRRASWRLNWSHGRIGRRHLRRIEARLAALPDGPARVVVCHHPFFAPDDGLRHKVLKRSDDALRLFRRHGVRLVLAGHLHRAFVHDLGGDDGGSPLLVVHGGTSFSTRLRGETNAFNLIELADDGTLRLDARVWVDGRWTEGSPPVLRVGGRPDQSPGAQSPGAQSPGAPTT